ATAAAHTRSAAAIRTKAANLFLAMASLLLSLRTRSLLARCGDPQIDYLEPSTTHAGRPGTARPRSRPPNRRTAREEPASTAGSTAATPWAGVQRNTAAGPPGSTSARRPSGSPTPCPTPTLGSPRRTAL